MMKVKLLEGNEMYLAKMVQAVDFEWDMDYQKETVTEEGNKVQCSVPLNGMARIVHVERPWRCAAAKKRTLWPSRWKTWCCLKTAAYGSCPFPPANRIGWRNARRNRTSPCHIMELF